MRDSGCRSTDGSSGEDIVSLGGNSGKPPTSRQSNEEVHHANHPELCHTARGDGRCRGSDRRCTDSRRGECADVRQLGCVGDSMIAGLPYTAMRDAVLAHPTMAEGLGGLFSNVPQR